MASGTIPIDTTFLHFTKTAGTATFAVPSSSVCILIHSSTTKANSGIWHITCNGSGGVTVTDLFSTPLPHANVTVSSSTNTVAFTFSSSISQNWMIVNLRNADAIALS